MTEWKDLKKQLENNIQILIVKFEAKQGIQFASFIADDILGIACFEDNYFINVSDIYYDIITKQPKGLILRWQEDCLENKEKTINYRSYCMGLRFEQIKN